MTYYIKHKKQCFIGTSEHEKRVIDTSWAQRSIFDEIRGIWVADETLSRVFDISSQSKLKLRCKRRRKMVKNLSNMLL